MLLTSLLLALCGIVLSLALGAAFSAMESTVLAVNRRRLLDLFGDEHLEPTSEQEIFRDTQNVYFASRAGLCATLVLAGFCAFRVANLALGAIDLGATARSSSAFLPALSALVTLLALPPFYILCVFGLPRLMVRLDAEEQCLPGWMRGLVWALRPVMQLSHVLALPLLSSLLPQHRLTKNDLVALVTDLDTDEDAEIGDARTSASAQNGALDEETGEDEIIYNILDLERTLVREVMKPINSVVAVRLGGTSVEGVCELARRTGFSRFPVYRDRIVDLTGHVNVYDILSATGEAPRPLESFVTPAYFVPEFMRVSDLLQEFLQRGEEVAVVVDEYGGSSGWVTREDVMEEIVGEIEDEFDARKRLLHKCDDGSYLADGGIDMDDLAEELPIEYDEEAQYDTLAGFLLMTLGRMPQAGEQVENEDAVFAIERMEGNRIAQVRIRLHPLRRSNGAN